MQGALLSGLAVQGAVPDSRFSRAAEFSCAYRLMRDDSFEHVLHAENISSKHFKIFFVRNNKNNARLGIIVSKKSIPLATNRNRGKRIIRETFRQHSIKAQKVDLVVMMRHADSKASSADSQELEMLFSRAGNRCATL